LLDFKTYIAREVEGAGAMNDGETDPLPENLEVEVLLKLAGRVEDGVQESLLVVKVPLEHQGKEAEPGGEEHIVESRQPVNEIDLPGEAIPVGEVEFSEDEDDVLIEVVANHLGDPDIPIATVHHQETLQESELRDGIVS
jgi:hypothetical protein